MIELNPPNFFGPGPEEMAKVSRFLSDEEYRLIQNNIVIGCTDVLIVDASTGEALSGFRQQKPQEGYWFSCGGRMKRGQSYQQAGASKVKAELGLEVDPARLEFITAYSTSFNERAQEPSDEGVHTSNAAMVLFIDPGERDQMTKQLALNEEHERADWIGLENILNQDDEFPPILQDAVFKVRKVLFGEFQRETVAELAPSATQTGFTIENAGYPETDLVVPEDYVFFDVESEGTNYSDGLWRTSVTSRSADSVVAGVDPNVENRDRFRGRRNEGVLLGPGESREVTTFLFGIPVTSSVTNNEGVGSVLIGRELPQNLVDKALELQRAFTRSSDLPTDGEMLQRFMAEQLIRRHLARGDDYTQERQPQQAREPQLV
ncbi:MAG TPA: NUDIX domain-containing protein [Candidatus Saccharimonadales bacterium]|nr:NUDIX domain-containing protein [Candidatus Saccharimonadales bacterium]